MNGVSQPSFESAKKSLLILARRVVMSCTLLVASFL
jgi:hypothetical protein